MRIAAAQLASGTDKEKNLTQITEMVGEATASGVELLVLPEYCSYWDSDEFGRGFRENSESVDGGTFVATLRALAARHRIWLIAGMLETAPQEEQRVFNTVVVISPSSRVELTYRKVHLYDAFGGAESRFLVSGDLAQEAEFTAGEFRVGIATCYDVRFPEMLRREQTRQPEIIFIPAVWTPGPLKSMHWDTLTRARAIENVAYLLAVTPPAPESIGQSRVINPDGTTHSEAGGQRTLLIADLDIEDVRSERIRNTSLNNRRYQVIGDER